MAAYIAGALTLAGATPRILLAAGGLPEWLRPFVWSDVLHTWERSGGAVPYWQSYFEYPPLTGYLAGVFAVVGGSALGYVLLWSVAQTALAAWTARELALEVGTRRALLFAAAPQLALFGSVNFDLLPAAALVVAVIRARRGRALAATLALAAGAAAKLFPAVALPPLLVQQRRPLLLASTAAAALALAYAPSALAPHSSLESITRYAAGIGANIDSVWGLLGGALAAAGIGSSAPVLVLTTAGLTVTYAAVLWRTRASADLAAPALMSVVTLLLWSRLFSPQYSLWVIPFFALVRLPARAYALLVAADVGVFVTIYPLTLVRWSASDPLPIALLGVLAASVVLRHVALIAVWRAGWRLVRTGDALRRP